MTPSLSDRSDDETRRARGRRLALLLVLAAAAVYVCYIVLAVTRARG
jgi:hypothetical protein